MTENIIEETQREAIVNRPWNLAGSIKRTETDRFNITKSDVTWGESSVVPALIKLFMESLDNPIDIAIKGGCSNIDITVNSKSIRVVDNGYGVNTGDIDGESVLYKAFCKYNTSSNYVDETKGQGQKGVNGIGIKLCTTLSSRFEVISQDTKGRAKVIATDNNLHHDVKKLRRSGGNKNNGVDVYFEPDFEIFEGDEIDKEHVDRMYEYTLMQALTYPNINFTFNGKTVKITPKEFTKLFGEDSVIEEQEDYFFAVVHNDSGNFKQLSYVNGLEISKGGTHISAIADTVVKNLRDKLMRKFKTIKPADIKNKITVIVIAKNMKHIDWEGQVKDTINSSPTAMKEFFSKSDMDKFTMKVYKNKTIIDSIIDYFKIKEEYNKRKDLNKMKKKVKISSDKYLPSIGRNKYIFIAEGQSATGGIMNPIGRKESAFYSLKGKPLNAITATTQKFTANKELTELFSIIQNEEFDYIIPATDQDLDGIHIRGLLIGFIYKYLPEYKHKIGLLNTPVIVVKKGKKILRWFYSLKDDIKLKAGEVSHYYKGLGTFKASDLEYIIEKEGLDKMIKMLDFDDECDDMIIKWMGDDSAPRKEYIMDNDFSIAKL